MNGIDKFMEQHGDAVAAQIKVFLPKLRKILKEHGIQAVCDSAYDLIDRINEQTGINKNISCTRGCHICCNGNIHVSSLEASYITSYVSQKKIPIDYKYLKKLNRSGDIDKLPLGKRMCPLLSEKGECQAYDVRPNVCRIYNSTEEPKLCDFDLYKKAVNTGRTAESMAIFYSMFELDRERGNALPEGKYMPLHKALWKTRNQ